MEFNLPDINFLYKSIVNGTWLTCTVAANGLKPWESTTTTVIFVLPMALSLENQQQTTVIIYFANGS